MTKAPSCASDRILLVSAPWPLYNRPSIQLGALKAFLKKRNTKTKVHTHHLYLDVAQQIGYDVYHAVSQRTWLAESVFGALLFPEKKNDAARLFRREAKGNKSLRGVAFAPLVDRVKQVSDRFVHAVPWADCRLVGFSVCLCQLTASLYLIRKIKACFPQIPIVVGGSMFCGEEAGPFLDSFPEIDFLVGGEGELPLSRLVEHLDCHEALPPIAGLVTRGQAGVASPSSPNQLDTLTELPIPDYGDYFRQLKAVAPDKTFFPTLPVEISRGCWWSSRRRTRGHQGCAFCNLNLQWQGYRAKKARQVASEIAALTDEHKVLAVAFMDNLLPMRASRKVFPSVAGLKKDLDLFGEIRATTPRALLETMKRAGIKEVQVGIEALSTGLLKKINKGTTAIQNLQIMKDCEELGIANISNLILWFPGSEEHEVQETLNALTYAAPFRPLRPVTFWLGLGSPVWRDRKAFGIQAAFNHPYYKMLFPFSVCRTVRFMIQSYRGDRNHQRRLWRPVKEKMRLWKKAYESLHGSPVCSPILAYGDGGDFLMIRERRPDASPMTHRLVGPSRQIYLYCRTHRSLKRILAKFPRLGEDKIVPFLKMLVGKRLMFEEQGRYLSLAVRKRH